MAGANSHKIEIKSHMEMGSLERKSSPDLEDLPLVNAQAIGRKESSLEITPSNHIVGSRSEDFGCKCTLSSIFRSVKIALFSNKLNMLIPCGPLAILVDKLTNHPGWVFFLSLLGIIPLAERLGWATEQIAFFTGPTGASRNLGQYGRKQTDSPHLEELHNNNDFTTFRLFLIGGLLNATFGNATELIISLYALRRGMLRVVQQSLLGSILSNMLLVLGCALFGGGIVHFRRQQVFNKPSAAMNSGLLLMAVMGLLFPAVLHVTRTELHFGKSELALSRFSSCIMLVAYCAYIFFQLTSQHHLYAPISQESPTSENSDEEEEAPDISKWESVTWLFILTSLISILSEYLVNTIEGASVAMNIPVAFISVILLPIVGNAAEHAGAVMFAVKDKLDISLGVAIGSSTQIAMFVIPFTVVVGWIMGRPMDLNFQLFETGTLFMTVLVVAFMLQEGTSNYFKGLMLLFCYLIVAASFFVHIDPESVR